MKVSGLVRDKIWYIASHEPTQLQLLGSETSFNPTKTYILECVYHATIASSKTTVGLSVLTDETETKNKRSARNMNYSKILSHLSFRNISDIGGKNDVLTSFG
ncbi:hypothetical protein AB6A40_011107 [Gnathostoma spinigerum]|uniref:Uncharacterized protein n=1 Tax=Gnathostoma spinigerum TaxID=75299 RepID=A0ABD6EWQ8_9BILA